jgi:hypothetical protein
VHNSGYRVQVISQFPVPRFKITFAADSLAGATFEQIGTVTVLDDPGKVIEGKQWYTIKDALGLFTAVAYTRKPESINLMFACGPMPCIN